MSKEQWITELERLLEDYNDEHYCAQQEVRGSFVDKLVAHGLTASEAEKMLEETIS